MGQINNPRRATYNSSATCNYYRKTKHFEIDCIRLHEFSKDFKFTMTKEYEPPKEKGYLDKNLSKENKTWILRVLELKDIKGELIEYRKILRSQAIHEKRYPTVLCGTSWVKNNIQTFWSKLSKKYNWDKQEYHIQI